MDNDQGNQQAGSLVWQSTGGGKVEEEKKRAAKRRREEFSEKLYILFLYERNVNS